MQKTNSSQKATDFPTDYPFIAILIGNDYKFFHPSDIVYCKSDGNYTKVCFRDGKFATTSKNLKDLEVLLPEDIFVRVHHSFIINLKYVTKYSNGDTQEIEMLNGEKVMISRRKKNVFLSKFVRL